MAIEIGEVRMIAMVNIPTYEQIIDRANTIFELGHDPGEY